MKGLSRSITFGIDSVKFRGSLLWNSTIDLIKGASAASIFKKNIGKWNGEECNCTICRQCFLVLYFVIYSSFCFIF